MPIRHYAAATVLLRRNYWLGITVVVLAALVGTSVFATLSGEVDVRLKIATGLVSLLLCWLVSRRFCDSRREQKGIVPRQLAAALLHANSSRLCIRNCGS